MSTRDTYAALPPRSHKGFPKGRGAQAVHDAEDNYPYPVTVTGTHGLAIAIKQYAQRNGHIVTVTRRNIQITVTHVGRTR